MWSGRGKAANTGTFFDADEHRLFFGFNDPRCQDGESTQRGIKHRRYDQLTKVSGGCGSCGCGDLHRSSIFIARLSDVFYRQDNALFDVQ
ncbi:MAG: hypothetical protein EAZ30_08845 [Betaproteobacteria bacterium]|nr:MAG: hypothetical protein EAZ30_08845 [Betaproteobacteria bacterium]